MCKVWTEWEEFICQSKKVREYMLNIGQCGEFKIFMPEEEIIPGCKLRNERALEINRRFLQTPGAADAFQLPITGTFVYAHPPDYAGNPTLNWEKREWGEVFQRLKKRGMDTVVFQASVWNELGEVYYRSAAFRSFRSWNVVEPMLEAARENGLVVFLGGYGSVSGWNLSPDDSSAAREVERQTACLSELHEYRELFDGIYYSPETAFQGKRDFNREKNLNRIYREYFGRVKEMAPEKKLLMSPASIYYPGQRGEFTESWMAILDDVPLDILAPQDSIGCACCTLEDQPEMWRWWSCVAQTKQIPLWANIELFERHGFCGSAPFTAASAERVAAQCGNVSPYVEKCICWEALYFRF